MQAAKKFAPVFLFVLALAAGYLSRPLTEGSAEQSSIFDMNIVSWDDISCLTAEENIKLYEILHLKAKVNPADCESQIDGRFNKAIAFLQTNQLHLPGDAFGEVTDVLRDPITFISENVPELDFDLKQDNSIAYNAMQRAVYLGGDFFRMDPYVSVAILIHEAWHSVKMDPGHERCVTGDIAQTKGGCDQAFSLVGNTIGAYSVTFSYLAAHGIYSKILPADKKKLLIDEALVLLSSRFNTGVQSYASVAETLAIINKDKNVELVHPLLGFKIPLASRSRDFVPRKLGYNQSHGGVLVFTEDQKLFDWSSSRPLQRYYSDIVPEDKKIIDAARLYLSVDDYAYSSLLLDDNTIYKVASGAGNEWSLVPTLAPQEQATQITTYHLYSAGFLDDQGRVYRIVQHGRGRGKPYALDTSIEKTNLRFRYITGEINTDNFWGVSLEGDVYYMAGNEFIKLTGTPQERVKKIQITNLGVYLLTDPGHVYYLPKSAVGRTEFPRVPDLEDVQDFSVTKRLIAQSRSFDELTSVATACTGKVIAADPYFAGYYWSQNKDRLLFGNNKTCMSIAQNVANFMFQHAPTQDFAEYKALLRRGTFSEEVRIWSPNALRR